MDMKKSLSIDPKLERYLLDRIVTNSLSYSLIWVYNNLHENKKDWNKFTQYIRNSRIVQEEYPEIIDVLDKMEENRSKNHLGTVLQTFFGYINSMKKSRENIFLDQMGAYECKPSEESREIFRLLKEEHNNQLACMDFKMNASFWINLTKKNKFVEVTNGGRRSCIVISSDRKEAYELFQVGDANSVKVGDIPVKVYGVRFNVSKEIEDVYSNLISLNSKLVKNEFLDS